MVYKLTIRYTLRFLIVYNYSHKLLFSTKKISNILALKFIYFLNLYFVVFFKEVNIVQKCLCQNNRFAAYQFDMKIIPNSFKVDRVNKLLKSIL